MTHHGPHSAGRCIAARVLLSGLLALPIAALAGCSADTDSGNKTESAAPGEGGSSTKSDAKTEAGSGTTSEPGSGTTY